MTDSTIDTLSLEIEASSTNADKALDKLVKTLLKLKKSTEAIGNLDFASASSGLRQMVDATRGLDISKLTNYAASLKSLSDSVRVFAADGKKIEPAIKNMEKLTNFDFSRLNISGNFSGFFGLAKGADEFAEAAKKLSGVEPKEINRSVKALEKLGTINLNGLASSMQALNEANFSNLTNLATALQSFSSSMIGTEKVMNGVTRLIDALARLSAASGNIPTVTANLPALSTEIQKFVNTMASASIVDSATVSIVTSLANIANAGARAQKTVAALPALSSGITAFVDSLSKLPPLNDSIVRAIEALARIAPTGAQAGSAAKCLKVNIDSLTGSMKKLRGGTGSAIGGIGSLAKQILSSLGLIGGLYGLIRAIQSSINAASDLAEIDNVVQQGFGDMRSKIDDFAKTAITSYGMSETAAKRAAGMYAVMGQSLGLSREKATDMAVSLTGLTGDLASFYNVSQDVANTALKSIFSGETESLKKFGVVMTEANLQQFAYANGINKSIKSMTQAEKVQLRYAFVMKATEQAYGDFANTAENSWANQVRILTEKFRDLATVVGTGLMNAFLPVIKVINRVMKSVVNLAKIISSFIGKMFNIQPVAASSGAGLSEIADSAGGIATNTNEAADGLNDMGSSAKKANKEMNSMAANWQEVTSMTSSKNDTSGTGGTNIGDIGGLGDTEGLLDIEQTEEKTDSMMNELEERASRLEEILSKLFQPFAESWEKEGKSTVESFTSMFSSLGDLASSVGGSLLDVWANGTGTETLSNIHQIAQNLMDTIGNLANRFTDAWNTAGLGTSIIQNLFDIFNSILDTIGSISESTAVWAGQLDFTPLLESINTLLEALKPLTDTIGAGLEWFWNNVLLPIAGWTIEEAVPAFLDMLSAAIDVLNTTIDALKPLGEWLWDTFLKPLGEWTGDIIIAALEGITDLLEKFAGWISDNEEIVQNYAVLIGSLAITWGTLNTAVKAWNKIVEIGPKLMSGLKAAFGFLTSPIGITTVAIGAAVAAGILLYKNWDEISAKAKEVWKFVQQKFQGFMDFIKGVFTKDWSESLGAFGEVLNGFFKVVSDVTGGVMDFFSGLIQFLTGVFTGDWDEAWSGVKKIFEGIWETFAGIVKAPINTIIGFINGLLSAVETMQNAIARALNKIHFDVPDWIEKLTGIGDFKFNLEMWTAPRIPLLEQGGILKKGQIGLLEGKGTEAVIPLERNLQWIDRVAERMAEDFGHYQLDLSVPKMDDKPTFDDMDTNEIKRKILLESDMDNAQSIYEAQQLKQSVDKGVSLLEKIWRKPTLSDDDVFSSARRGQDRFNRRTGITGWSGVD